MPLIATELHRATGSTLTVLDQPELVVAEGALLVGVPIVSRARLHIPGA
jgi:predicted aconitase with swiveling domain